MPSLRTNPDFTRGAGAFVGLAALTLAQPVSALPPSATLAASIVRLLILFIECRAQLRPRAGRGQVTRCSCGHGALRSGLPHQPSKDLEGAVRDRSRELRQSSLAAR